MSTDNQRRYARPQDAAKYFGVNPVTIWRWSKSSSFPAPKRVGSRLVLYDLPAIEHWLSTNKEAVQ